MKYKVIVEKGGELNTIFVEARSSANIQKELPLKGYKIISIIIPDEVVQTLYSIRISNTIHERIPYGALFFLLERKREIKITEVTNVQGQNINLDNILTGRLPDDRIEANLYIENTAISESVNKIQKQMERYKNVKSRFAVYGTAVLIFVIIAFSVVAMRDSEWLYNLKNRPGSSGNPQFNTGNDQIPQSRCRKCAAKITWMYVGGDLCESCTKMNEAIIEEINRNKSLEKKNRDNR